MLVSDTGCLSEYSTSKDLRPIVDLIEERFFVVVYDLLEVLG